MSQFCTHAVGTLIDLLVDDDATANTRSESQHQHVVEALGCARQGLPIGCAVGIVVDFHWQWQQRFQKVVDGHVFPAEAVGMNQEIGLLVHATGHADAPTADVIHRETCLGNSLAANGSHITCNLLDTTTCTCRQAAFCQNLKLIIHHTGHQVGAANVESEMILFTLHISCYFV